jgi:hypothetical protein
MWGLSPHCCTPPSVLRLQDPTQALAKSIDVLGLLRKRGVEGNVDFLREAIAARSKQRPLQRHGSL